MTEAKVGSMLVEQKKCDRPKLGALLLYAPSTEEEVSNKRLSNVNGAGSPVNSTTTSSNNGSPFTMSPWNQSSFSPYNKSPWQLPSIDDECYLNQQNAYGLVGSLVREEGHIYSLAVAGDLLYTGSDSRNIRVWKDLRDFTGFKSSSGLVKTIVISGHKIFTGHQDGKIRIWKTSHKNPTNHKRIGSLPKFNDLVKTSMNPKNYVRVRRHRNAVKVKHFDAVSSLSLDEEEGLLYSASWDKTVKVWRVADSKCLESIDAHDDAVNAVAAAFGGYVLTGSADGSMKVWRREPRGKKTKHELDRILLKQENAVTSLAVNRQSAVVYCGSSNGLVNYWEGDEEKNLILIHGGALRGHKLAVLCLAAAGSLVFSGSADKNVCVWKREESGLHTCLSVLTGHMGPVKCIAVQQESSDNHGGAPRWIVYTGSLDKSVKVWRVTDHAPHWRMLPVHDTFSSPLTLPSTPNNLNVLAPYPSAARFSCSSPPSNTFSVAVAPDTLQSPATNFRNTWLKLGANHATAREGRRR